MSQRFLSPTKRLRRRRSIVLQLLGLLLLVGIYGSCIELRWVAVEQVSLTLPRLPRQFSGLRIVQLSDFHYSKWLGDGYYRGIVARVNQMQPDLIVLTGDFITRDTYDAIPCAKNLGQLHARYGVFAILGNHDHHLPTTAAIVAQAFTKQRITVLRNTAALFTRQGARLWLVGLDDACFRCENPLQALYGLPDSDVKILLVHEPDYADTAQKLPVDLQLSGHSHGGQVRIPFFGGFHYPPMANKYPLGLNHAGRLLVYTNRGLGNIIPFRFNCRPEITLLTLNAGTIR